MKTARHIAIIQTEYGDTILLNTETHRRLRLNGNSLFLFELSQKHTDLDAITAEYNTKSGQFVGKEEVQKLLQRFTSFETNTSSFKVSSYLLIHTKLIPARFVNAAAAVFAKCIPECPRRFYYIFFILTAISALFFTAHFSVASLKPAPEHLWLHVTLLISIFILHEFGHAAAAVKYGAVPQEIGFGFYLLTPAFYCNLSDIWRLTSARRNVVNLSGIYFQLIISSLLILTYLLLQLPYIKTLILLNIILVFINLNPLLKYDGYWVLCDLFNVPNLRRSSYSALGKIISARGMGLPRRTWALSVYAAVSSAFLAYFLFYFVLPNLKVIGLFPYELVKHLVAAADTLSPAAFFAFLKANVLSIIFYYMIINIAYGQYLKRKLKNKIRSHAI